MGLQENQVFPYEAREDKFHWWILADAAGLLWELQKADGKEELEVHEILGGSACEGQRGRVCGESLRIWCIADICQGKKEGELARKSQAVVQFQGGLNLIYQEL